MSPFLPGGVVRTPMDEHIGIDYSLLRDPIVTSDALDMDFKVLASGKFWDGAGRNTAAGTWGVLCSVWAPHSPLLPPQIPPTPPLLHRSSRLRRSGGGGKLEVKAVLAASWPGPQPLGQLSLPGSGMVPLLQQEPGQWPGRCRCAPQPHPMLGGAASPVAGAQG